MDFYVDVYFNVIKHLSRGLVEGVTVIKTEEYPYDVVIGNSDEFIKLSLRYTSLILDLSRIKHKVCLSSFYEYDISIIKEKCTKDYLPSLLADKIKRQLMDPPDP